MEAPRGTSRTSGNTRHLHTTFGFKHPHGMLKVQSSSSCCRAVPLAFYHGDVPGGEGRREVGTSLEGRDGGEVGTSLEGRDGGAGHLGAQAGGIWQHCPV